MKERSDKIRLYCPLASVIERQFSAATSPGHLVESDGDKVKPQVTAGANCQRAFALEMTNSAKTKEDQIPVDGYCQVVITKPGDRIQGKVKANAAAIQVGDLLQSAGGGAVEKLAGANTPIAKALEAIDNSANANQVFINMEIF